MWEISAGLELEHEKISSVGGSKSARRGSLDAGGRGGGRGDQIRGGSKSVVTPGWSLCYTRDIAIVSTAQDKGLSLALALLSLSV